MIRCVDFYNELIENKIDFFCGVPDSLLKNICAYIKDHTDEQHHIITANEGSAIALASGYFMGSSKPALVYMQNSGIGNAVNPLVSLCDKSIYAIPMILMIGWRGEPGVKDEPQHLKQGEITPALLETLQIPYSIIGPATQNIEKILSNAVEQTKRDSHPFALLVKKDSFDSYKLAREPYSKSNLSREEAIALTTESFGDQAFFIATTGKISRELYEYREQADKTHDSDFLTVGSMGHASSIALGINLSQPQKKVICFDGDGAMLMHLGNAAVNGVYSNENFFHVVFNNQAHESVGGQPTIAGEIDLCGIASNCRYLKSYKIESREELISQLPMINKEKGPIFVEILVQCGSRDDLGRPNKTPKEQKIAYIKKVQSQG
ncbi:MAG: phosphonopyruvate decarboxylase [Spirochaetaceae bacterium]|jgi:phosphonopyruvate decarboxylase|nr:phosphonopyruvate decarboxylase [Spirochaetaceae bacterium]